MWKLRCMFLIIYMYNYMCVNYYTCSGSWILSHMKPSGFHMYYICIYMYM